MKRDLVRVLAWGGLAVCGALMSAAAGCSSGDDTADEGTGASSASPAGPGASMGPGGSSPGSTSQAPGTAEGMGAGSAMNGSQQPSSGAPVNNAGGAGGSQTSGPDDEGSAEVPTGDSPEDPAEGAGETPVEGPSEWTQMGYDAASSYFNRAETVLTKENAATLEEAWKVDMGSPVYGAPLQVDDKIYASSTGGVRAFEAASGDELWRVRTSSTASMAYTDGTLYLNTTGGEVTALDAADGSQLWSQAPDSQRADGSSSPLIAGDLILVGGSSGSRELIGGAFRGYLAALDRMTGDVAWVTHTVPQSANGASIWSSASADLAAGVAYASTGNNYGAPATDTSDAIIAFDLETGEILWKNQRTENDTFGGGGGDGPDYDFGANPVLYETMVDGEMTQLVSAGAKSGSAHAVRRDDGSLVWTRSLGPGYADGSSGIFVNSTWSGKNMLFAENEESHATLYALDGATGDIAWQRELDGLVWGRMSVANGVGFVGTGETLQVFDVDTGDVIKEFPSDGGTVAGTISIANGRVAYGEGFTWSSGKSGRMLHVLEVQQ